MLSRDHISSRTSTYMLVHDHASAGVDSRAPATVVGPTAPGARALVPRARGRRDPHPLLTGPIGQRMEVSANGGLMRRVAVAS